MSDPLLEAVAQALVPEVVEVAEIYAKEGRSRLIRWDASGFTMAMRHEEGWGVRAGARASSFFYAATGRPDPASPWPGLRAPALRLPEPGPLPAWTEPPELATPMITENEGLALVEGIRKGLGEEAPEAELHRIVLEDGSSRSELLSTRGMRASWRHRSARLSLALGAGGSSQPILAMDIAAREARAFHPRRISRRLADRLFVRQTGQLPERDRGELLLAPEVAIRILQGLLPIFVGSAAPERMAALRDRSDRVASSLVTLVDDGRLAEGTLAAAVDGEGLATRRALLVEEGVGLQPLLPWWHAKRKPSWRAGASRRDSWRDAPRPGPPISTCNHRARSRWPICCKPYRAATT